MMVFKDNCWDFQIHALETVVVVNTVLSSGFLREKVTIKDPMDKTTKITMIKAATILATISLVSMFYKSPH